MSMKKYTSDFPILKRKVNGKRLVYLDSAATSQKPIQVIKAITNFYSNYNANIHRAIHTLGEKATFEYEQAREKIANFINAESPEEIIFVRNTTEALNFASFGLRNFIKKNDKILTTTMEHHSNLIPWQQLAKSKKAKLDFVDFDKNGYLNMKEFDEKVNDTKVVAMTQASNVLGTINPIKKIAVKVKQSGSIFVVDGAQSVPHMPVDVQELGVDMLAFSGHKMLGPTGIGVLYARKELLEKMQPVLFGSDMIRRVSLTDAEWNDLPYRFEYGTPNISGVIGLGAAVDYLLKIKMKKIRQHDVDITKYALKKISKVAIIYGPKKAEDRSGLLAFNLDNAHPHDIAAILNQEGIAIRSGHHCAMPLHEKLKISASARASFYLYNEKSDIDLLLKSLLKVKKLFS